MFIKILIFNYFFGLKKTEWSKFPGPLERVGPWGNSPQPLASGQTYLSVYPNVRQRRNPDARARTIHGTVRVSIPNFVKLLLLYCHAEIGRRRRRPHTPRRRLRLRQKNLLFDVKIWFYERYKNRKYPTVVFHNRPWLKHHVLRNCVSIEPPLRYIFRVYPLPVYDDIFLNYRRAYTVETI